MTLRYLTALTSARIEAPFNKPDLVVFTVFIIRNILRYQNIYTKTTYLYNYFPHGSLSKKSDQIRFFQVYKRALAHLLILNSFIKKAKALQFLSKGEQANSHFSNKGTNIPNGIEAPQGYDKPLPKTKEGINITFIGRKNKKNKGLDLLLKAVNKIKDELARHKVKIHIYGPNRGNTDKYINKFIKNTGFKRHSF